MKALSLPIGATLTCVTAALAITAAAMLVAMSPLRPCAIRRLAAAPCADTRRVVVEVDAGGLPDCADSGCARVDL